MLMFRQIVLVCCVAIGGATCVEKEDSTRLTLFYESYCPYSIEFIVDQLYGTWQFFKSHLQLDLVPFGNAQQSYSKGHFHFVCQHGPKECVGNTLHACAIYQACGGRGTRGCGVPRLGTVMEYIYCTVNSTDQRAASDECAKQAGIDARAINKCANGRVGERLESGYGNQTKAYHTPPISYVPFIVINGKHNETMQDDAQTDLKALICRYIPDRCKNQRL